MKYIEENHNLIRTVAEGIGWCHEDTPPMVWPDEPEVFKKYTPIDDADDLIVFSLKAKAAMAQRGWVPFAEGNTVACTIELYDEWGEQANGNQRATSSYDYDPKDPISEALAILQCCADALISQPAKPQGADELPQERAGNYGRGEMSHA